MIPYLPYASLRSMARVLGGAAFALDKRGRKVAVGNVRMAFGDTMSEAEVTRTAKDSYRQFARTMLELFWSPNLTRESYKKFIVPEGYDRLREVARGGGAIGVCLHYGNFEWLSLVSGYEVTQGIIVTQKFYNPLIGPIFDRLRATSGHRIIQQERSMLSTFKHLKGGGSVGILTDLQLHPRFHPTVPVKSFGRWCPMTKMHAILHKRTGLPIVPMESIPLPDGRYRMVAHEPMFFPESASEREIVQACWDVLEPQIRRLPAPWLWAYKHWRFRAKDDPGIYPWYADPNGSFDDLLAEHFGDNPST